MTDAGFRSPLTGPGSIPAFLPARDPRSPETFLSIDGLAAHLLRQRPGKKLELLSQTASDSGSDPFPVVAVFALKPVTVRDFRRSWADRELPAMRQTMQDDWIGWTCGDLAGDPAALTAALARVQSAGGLAA